MGTDWFISFDEYVEPMLFARRSELIEIAHLQGNTIIGEGRERDTVPSPYDQAIHMVPNYSRYHIHSIVQPENRLQPIERIL